MPDFRDFATEKYPLRVSSIPLLVQCSMHSALKHVGALEDTSGAAAQTGSVAHAYIEAWHTGKAVPSDLAERFPLADFKLAKRRVDAYKADPRNAKDAVEDCEVKCSLWLTPTIYIQGTLDQIRREAGALTVWDVKNSMKMPHEIYNTYIMQLATYAVAATRTLGEMVHPGGFIRLPAYDDTDRLRENWTEGLTLDDLVAAGVSKPTAKKYLDGSSVPRMNTAKKLCEAGIDCIEKGEANPFIPANISHDDCHLLLEVLEQEVKTIRSGTAYPRPGAHCAYCPAGGVNGCLKISKDLSCS